MRIAELRGGDHYRLYQVHNDDDSHITTVRVWTEGNGHGATFVSTTIGGPSKVTSGPFTNDTDAITAHFAPESHEDELQALAAGIDDGWHATRNQTVVGGDAFPSIWRAARWGADNLYPNGWRGGDCASQCRAAYIGGWAIGVQRYADGVGADGSTVKLNEILRRRGDGYVNPAQIPSHGYTAPMAPGGIDS